MIKRLIHEMAIPAVRAAVVPLAGCQKQNLQHLEEATRQAAARGVCCTFGGGGWGGFGW